MKNKDYLMYYFFYIKFREIIPIPAMIHALITDGVKFVKNKKIIRNIPVIISVLRFPMFSFESMVFIPIMIIPHMCARYSKYMIYTASSKIFYYFF